jgi:hypothetical protein
LIIWSSGHWSLGTLSWHSTVEDPLISRLSGFLLTGTLAAAITIALAWPIVLNPSELVYGHEIVGRHPDVHSAIATIAGEGEGWTHPLTDGIGWLLARFVNPVAALNLIVLAAFPLTAMATYALARYLHGSHAAAMIAALVFAFAPLHLAQAAYHPYAAQTYWLPLYLLALVALIDRATPLRFAGLCLVCAALILAGREAAFIAAMISPAVLLAFWVIRSDADRNLWPLARPLLGLAVVAAVTAGVVWWARPDLLVLPSTSDVPIEDVGFYRARWWAYFTPPVDHPMLGRVARHLFARGGINLQLLEQQVFLGFSFVALALAALAFAATWRPESRFVVAVAAVGLVAALISLGPVSGSCGRVSMAPGCLAFYVFPAFRTYARFADVTALAVAIAAGIGAVYLARMSRFGRGIAAALLALGAFELLPLPARAHDVLPTSAHRSLAASAGAGRILDCYPPGRADARVAWLMKRDLSFLDASLPTCADPELGARLAAHGFTHMIVRGGNAASRPADPLPPGIQIAEQFHDATVYSVSPHVPPIATIASAGFFGYEHEGADWWQWMSPRGEWTVRNSTPAPLPATLSVDLVAIGMPRRLSVSLDGTTVASFAVDVTRQAHVLGPWTLTPGDHTLVFVTDGDPVRPSDAADGSTDRRPLTIAFRHTRWNLADR